MTATINAFAINDIVLDDLSTEDLLRERSEVKIAIADIDAQLKDHTRRPRGTEDESPAWDAYREWRRRARWALVYRRKELEDIKGLLTERRDTGTVGHRLKAESDPEARAARRAAEEAHAATVAALRADLREAGPDGLLVRAYRALRHLIADGQWPDALDAEDREAIKNVAAYLQDRVGRVTLREYLDGEKDSTP